MRLGAYSRCRRRLAVMLAALGIVFTTSALNLPHAAASVTCSGAYSPNNYHCYSYAWLSVANPSGFLGVFAELRTNCLTVSSYSSSVAFNDLWFQYRVGGSLYWVEAGIYVGNLSGGLGETTSPLVFWADQRPSAPYYSHGIGAYSLGGYSDLEIVKNSAGSSVINVYVNGGYTGVSNPNFATSANEIAAGNETTTNSIHTYGSASSLEYLTLDSTWHPGWATAGGGYPSLFSYQYATGQTAQPPYFSPYWISAYDWLRSGAGSAC